MCLFNKRTQELNNQNSTARTENEQKKTQSLNTLKQNNKLKEHQAQTLFKL